MSLRTSNRTEKIVAAATQLFARQGYHGTSTREIARVAEVSENTLFRHFDHKEDIFWSALRSQSEVLKPRLEMLAGIRTGDTPTVVLPKLLELLTDTVCHQPEVLRLIAIAFLELQGNAEEICRDLLAPFFSEINRYLVVSIARGEVLEVDPTLLVASLMAMVLMHPQLSKLTEGRTTAPLDSQDAARAYSKFWLNVLSPRMPAAAGSLAQRDARSAI